MSDAEQLRSELEQLLPEWQAILRLQAWDIWVKVVRSHSGMADGYGEVSWKLAGRQAEIRILDPVDVEGVQWHHYDPERTLVHELLHVLFAPFCRMKGPKEPFEHQAVYTLAQTLVALKRGTS